MNVVQLPERRAADIRPPRHKPPATSAGAPAPAPGPEYGGDESAVDRQIHAAITRICGGFSPMGLVEAWFDWTVHLAVSPGRVGELVSKGTTEALRIAGLSVEMLTQDGVCIPCEKSLPQDKRFRHEDWQKWPFALYAESFLSLERWWDDVTKDIHGATQHHLALINFVGHQAIDVAAPSNFVATNPEVFKATIDTGGLNLLKGMRCAYEDMRQILAHEPPEGAAAFRPGESVAATPGEVILRTPLAEVIQYRPSTGKTRPEPIVIVPAWIMKYYILDLRPQNSLVKHLVGEGFTVFMISWKNPGNEDRNIGFDDYRTLGVLPAIEAALAVTGARAAHGVGYCVGGTLLAAAAAAMARDHDARLKSLTLLAAQTDFTEAGELRLFIDESQLAMLDDMMAEEGTFKASQMAGTFHLLRSNDLIWSRVIRRYLMGEREALSDVAAWSTDTTRLPYRMHSEYLRRLYLDNDLAEGRFAVGGRPVALQDIRAPIFAVGAEWDHVAPWRSVHKLHLFTETELTFCLTNGGHNQGILSPPSREDRHFRTATARSGQTHLDPDSWLAEMTSLEGSWWPAWFGWLGEHSGPPGPPPPMGQPERGFVPLGAAPGSYVFG